MGLRAYTPRCMSICSRSRNNHVDTPQKALAIHNSCTGSARMKGIHTYSREGNAQNESHPKDSPHEQINEVSSERGGRKVRGDENPSSSGITVTFSAAYINTNRDEGTAAQKTFSMMVPQHERTRSARAKRWGECDGTKVHHS